MGVLFRHRSPRASVAAAALVLALLAAACGTANPSLNTQLPVLQETTDDLLAADDIAAAMGIARGLERRLPGVDTYAMLGRVIWRAGDLVQAEALFRRGARGGDPEGLLGLARSRAARMDLAGAAGIVDELVAVGPVAARAHRLLAALAWAQDRVADAARELGAAADLPGNQRQARDRAEAEVLAAIAAADPADALGWTGGGAVLRVRASDMTVAGTIDGRAARLRLSPMDDRTAVSPRVVALRGDGDDGESSPVLAVAIGLQSLRAAHVPVQVRELADGVDGRIGFDVLGRLTWALDVSGGRLEVSAATAPRGSDGGLPRPPYLPRTYWAAARVPRDGLAVQLLLMPRIQGRVLSAAVDPGGIDLIDGRTFTDRVRRREDGPIPAELRLGAWRQIVSWEITDLYPEGEDGAVAPQAVLGERALRGWRLYWTPEARSLVLERVTENTGLQ